MQMRKTHIFCKVKWKNVRFVLFHQQSHQYVSWLVYNPNRVVTFDDSLQKFHT